MPSNGLIRTSGPAVRGDGPQPSSDADQPIDRGPQNPFEDCIDTFGLYTSSLFDGCKVKEVNGYIKFSMLKDGRGKPPSVNHTTSMSDSIVIELDDSMSQCSITVGGRSRASLRSANHSTEFTCGVSNVVNQCSAGSSTPHSLAGYYPRFTCSNPSTRVSPMGAPKMLPFRYGHEAKMDGIDSRLWLFCT